MITRCDAEASFTVNLSTANPLIVLEVKSTCHCRLILVHECAVVANEDGSNVAISQDSD